MYIKDTRFLTGLGVGIVITALLLSLNPSYKLSKLEVEKRARNMGMKYPDEIKAYFNNDKNKR